MRGIIDAPGITSDYKTIYYVTYPYNTPLEQSYFHMLSALRALSYGENKKDYDQNVFCSRFCCQVQCYILYAT